MKKILGLSLAAAIALTTSVSAEDAKFKVSSNAALTSNYIWRGISYTDNTPTAQMGVDFSNLFNAEGLHLNLWGSGIQEGSEIDTIVGYETSLGGLGIDIGLINYYYTQDDVPGTFAGDTYAEAYVAFTAGDYGLSVWKELTWRDYESTTPSAYDGLTVIADASVLGLDLSVGTRMDAGKSAGETETSSSRFGSIGTSWDSILIPSYTTGIMFAYNDSDFASNQKIFGKAGLTFALTFSKDF